MAENKILIVRGGAIGDFILTLPVFDALRVQFPDTRLSVLGYPRVAELARWSGLADEVRSLEDRAVARFFARKAEIDPEWQEYLSRFAIVISYLFDPDGIFQENVTRSMKGQFIAGPHRPPDAGPRHATDVLLQPLQRLAIFAEGAAPRLSPPDAGRGSGKTAPQPWPAGHRTLAIHPGSGSDLKNWPESHWRVLLAELAQADNLHLVLIGGEAEEGRLERLASVIPPERVTILRNRPLTEVASLLARCDRFVGHDSGISHLAAALGVQTVVLWGPTAEQVWAPRGPRVRIIPSPEGLPRLDVITVLRAVQPRG